MFEDEASATVDIYDVDEKLVKITRNQLQRLIRLTNQHDNFIKRARLLTRQFINKEKDVNLILAIDVKAKMLEFYHSLYTA